MSSFILVKEIDSHNVFVADIDDHNLSDDKIKSIIERVISEMKNTNADKDHSSESSGLYEDTIISMLNYGNILLSSPHDNIYTTVFRAAGKHIVELCGIVENLNNRVKELNENKGLGLTVGDGLSVFGTHEAIHRVQNYIMIDSNHPVESKDVRRGLARDLQNAEKELSRLRTFVDSGIIMTADDGSHVELSSYSGQRSPEGVWGKLTLSFVNPDGTNTLRTYFADDLIADEDETTADDIDIRPWTLRLANVNQRTPIELRVSGLIWAIEKMGGHPLLTQAQNYINRALCTLGSWTDAGEPGKNPKCYDLDI